MPGNTRQPNVRTRRWFLAATAAGVGSMIVENSRASAAMRRRSREARFFDVVHDSSVAVLIANGRRFVVCVKDTATGEILERHERVTAGNLLDLRSTYVQIVERADL